MTLLEPPLLRPPTTLPGKSKGRGRGAAAVGAGRPGYAHTLERGTLTSVCAAERDWMTLDRVRTGESDRP